MLTGLVRAGQAPVTHLRFDSRFNHNHGLKVQMVLNPIQKFRGTERGDQLLNPAGDGATHYEISTCKLIPGSIHTTVKDVAIHFRPSES